MALISGSAGGSEQVPAVAFNIQEHRHLSIWLGPWRCNEAYARGEHARVRRVEVIHPEKETDPARELIPDDRLLMLPVGAREQNPRAASPRPNDDPALRPAIVGQRRNVLHELELQDVDEEIDRRLILSNHQRDQLDL